MTDSNNREIVRNTDEARQGTTGHHVRGVLGWSISLAIVALAVLWFVFVKT